MQQDVVSYEDDLKLSSLSLAASHEHCCPSSLWQRFEKTACSRARLRKTTGYQATAVRKWVF